MISTMHRPTSIVAPTLRGGDGEVKQTTERAKAAKVRTWSRRGDHQ
jgi:hypothetical protein